MDEIKDAEWTCCPDLRMAFTDGKGGVVWSLNGSGAPAGIDLFHGGYVDSLRAEMERLKRIEFAWDEWSAKTEWVQKTAAPRELGMHRADVLRLRVEQAEAEVDALRKELERLKFWRDNPERMGQ